MRRQLWGVADQALFSATGFALSIAVASVSDVRTFGAFSVVYILFVLVLGVSEALTGEVLVVRFSDAAPEAFREALARATGSALVISGGMAVPAVVCGALVGSDVGPMILIFVVFGSLLFLEDAVRFGWFGSHQPVGAFATDAAWVVMQGLAFGWLFWSGTATSTTLTAAWGTAGALAGVGGLVAARVRPELRGGVTWLRDHWRFGSAFAAEYLMLFGAAQVLLGLAGVFRGLSEVAALRGALLAFGPLQVMLSAMRPALVPVIARGRSEGSGGVLRQGRMATFGAAGVTAVFSGALLAIPQSLGAKLLGDTWALARPLFVTLAVVHLFVALSLGGILVLRGLAAPRRSFRVRAATSVAMLLFGVVGVLVKGALGAAVGMGIAHAGGAVLMWWQAGVAAHELPIPSDAESGRAEVLFEGPEPT